jgi:hypothetical protein
MKSRSGLTNAASTFTVNEHIAVSIIEPPPTWPHSRVKIGITVNHKLNDSAQTAPKSKHTRSCLEWRHEYTFDQVSSTVQRAAGGAVSASRAKNVGLPKAVSAEN